MIDTLQHEARLARTLWAGTIRKQFQTLELEDRPCSDAVSDSIALFCQALRRLDGCALSLIMARSLCAAGDAEAAGRVLSRDAACRSCVDTWLDVLTGEYPFPEIFPLFSSRALHPIHLHTVPGGTVWVLDFDRILLADTACHELILFQTLRTLTEKISNVWKRSDGKGVLGIKGLKRVLRGQSVRNMQNEAQCTAYIQDVLAREAVKACWSAVPSVLLIDL